MDCGASLGRPGRGGRSVGAVLVAGGTLRSVGARHRASLCPAHRGYRAGNAGGSACREPAGTGRDAGRHHPARRLRQRSCPPRDPADPAARHPHRLVRRDSHGRYAADQQAALSRSVELLHQLRAVPRGARTAQRRALGRVLDRLRGARPASVDDPVRRRRVAPRGMGGAPEREAEHRARRRRDPGALPPAALRGHAVHPCGRHRRSRYHEVRAGRPQRRSRRSRRDARFEQLAGRVLFRPAGARGRRDRAPVAAEQPSRHRAAGIDPHRRNRQDDDPCP